jgi:hypothetical protein
MLIKNKMQLFSNKMSNGALQLKGKFFLSSPFPQVDGQIDSAIVGFYPFYPWRIYANTSHQLVIYNPTRKGCYDVEHIVRAGDSIDE